MRNFPTSRIRDAFPDCRGKQYTVASQPRAPPAAPPQWVGSVVLLKVPISTHGVRTTTIAGEIRRERLSLNRRIQFFQVRLELRGGHSLSLGPQICYRVRQDVVFKLQPADLSRVCCFARPVSLCSCH